MSLDPGEPDSIECSLDGIRRFMQQLGEDIGARLEQDTDPEIACELLFQLREALDPLKDLTASVEATAAQRMTGKPLRFGDLIAERKGGSIRKQWEHDRLAWSVMQGALAAGNDGELPDETVMATATLIRDALLDAAQITGWRVSILKPMGIDPDNYCITDRYRHTVIVRRDVDEAASDAA